jgi:hypothetical protein
MATAFVLGNGRSRLQINPLELKNIGKLYACNAVYRDFMPNYLIAVDAKMIIELTENGIQNKTEVWTNPNRRYHGFQGLHYFNPSKGWSSGPTALWLASVNIMNTFEPVKEIYILGFDYVGIENKKFNNVYSDTKNYKRSVEPATFFGNWLTQTESVIKEFKDVKYYRVIDDGQFVPPWTGLSNIEHISFNTFKSKVNYQNSQF